MQSERDWRKRRRIRGRRRKRNGGPRGREKGRWGGWCGWIGRGQCKLLSAVRNLRMRSWSVENFPLIVFWFNYFREHYMDRVRRRQAGWEEDWSFYFLIFFCKYIWLLFFLQCFTIIIIKCKASFSCHSSSSHYSTQGFVLISFSFNFFFFNKK